MALLRAVGGRGGLERFEDWHWVTYDRKHIALPLRRRLPHGFAPFGGGAYWCFARPLVDYVQRFVTTSRDYVRFFEHVLIPDELFFQTLIMNSTLRDSVVNDNLRYLDWSREPAPAVLASGTSTGCSARNGSSREVRRDRRPRCARPARRGDRRGGSR